MREAQQLTIPLSFAILFAIAASTAAVAQADETRQMVDAWYVANSLCRGSTSEKEVVPSCAFRDDVLAPRLRRAGMCYGKKTEPNNNLTWHKCGPGSRRD